MSTSEKYTVDHRLQFNEVRVRFSLFSSCFAAPSASESANKHHRQCDPGHFATNKLSRHEMLV